MDEGVSGGKVLASLQQVLNRVSKWRMVFASWQLGTRAKSDPEAAALADHREGTLMLRIEMNAVARLLIDKRIISQEEWINYLGNEAIAYDQMLQERFPGFTATDTGMHMDVQQAAKTMEGWPP